MPPFFGQLDDHLLVASGLGSSGLTTGPYIGYLLAHYLNTGEANWQVYQKNCQLIFSAKKRRNQTKIPAFRYIDLKFFSNRSIIQASRLVLPASVLASK